MILGVLLLSMIGLIIFLCKKLSKPRRGVQVSQSRKQPSARAQREAYARRYNLGDEENEKPPKSEVKDIEKAEKIDDEEENQILANQ